MSLKTAINNNRIGLWLQVALSFSVMLAMVDTAQAEEAITYGALDGDTIVIAERCDRFNSQNRKLRVYGIDTPESSFVRGKCAAEVAKGKEAKKFAQSLIKRGDTIEFQYVTKDKWECRWVANVTLADGRDFANTMIAAGHARPYGVSKGKGALTKSDWCK